jgi:hypothetical protein
MPIDTSLMGSAPPKRSGARATPAPRKTIIDTRTEAVAGIFQLAGFGCVVTGNYADAAAIGIHSPAISTEVVKLGAQNESVGKAIDYLNEVGPYAGLISAVMPLVLQLLANHKRLDATKVPGLSEPSVLEAKVKADMAAVAAQEMREAREAQKRYQQELASMEEMLRMDTISSANSQQST